MLDLSTLSEIKNDIESSHVTAYPLIVIGGEIYISTIKEVISSVPYEDYNLKISNIKESIDLKNHKFKISNVNITLSNYSNNNKRFSDRFFESFGDGINTEVVVYYKTQSCQKFSDLLPLYKGKIRRYDHDSSSIKITLEDLTDEAFHKDVPIANLGTRKECFSKEYFNKYIPMTYGEVDKAPAIPYINNVGLSGEYYISIIADDVDYVTQSGRRISTYNFGTNEEISENRMLPTNKENGVEVNHPLYIYKDNYFKILQNYESDFHDLGVEGFVIYNDSEQYRIDDTRSFLTIRKKYASGYFQNPPANNELQGYKIHHPTQAEVVFTDLEQDPDGVSGASQSRIINIDANIFRPDASFDTPEKPSLFFDEQISGEFGTYSEIPYNQINLAGDENFVTESFSVTDFEPYTDNVNFKGIWYPDEDFPNQPNMYSTSFLWWVSAWLITNSYLLNQVDGYESVKIVCLPHIGQIKNKLVEFLENPDNGITVGGGEDLLDYSGTGHRVVPQYQLDDTFRDEWISASGLTGEEKENLTKLRFSSSAFSMHNNADFDSSQPYWYLNSEYLNPGDGDIPGYIRHINEDYSLVGGNYDPVTTIYNKYIKIVPPFHDFETYGTYNDGLAGYQGGGSFTWSYDEQAMLSNPYISVDDPTNDEGAPQAEVWHHYFPRVTKNVNFSNHKNLNTSIASFKVWKANAVAFSHPTEFWSYHDGYIYRVNTNKSILSGKLGTKPAYYPTCVIKFQLIDGDNDSQNLNLFNYNHIYVGQWITETMGSYGDNGNNTEEDYTGQGAYKWINLWNDGSDIPYLFDSFDDFAVYTPKTLSSKSWGNSDRLTLASKFDCDWNGISRSDVHGNSSNEDDIVWAGAYASGYGRIFDGSGQIRENQIFARNDTNGEGGSWFVYTEDTIGADKTMQRLPGDTSNLYEWFCSTPSPDSEEIGVNKGTIVPKGCLIPMSHKTLSLNGETWANAVAGLSEGNVVVFGENKESIRLEAGDNTNAERRLNLLFPFSSIGNKDVLEGETNMYIYGKIKLFVDADPDDGVETNIMTGNDKLLVQALPASGESEGNIDFNEVDLGNSVDLISIEGNDNEVFENNEIQEIKWETVSGYENEGTDNIENIYTSLDNYYMPEWLEPNEFNALSLVYRVVGNYGAQAQISTNVHSLGVIQFSIFEKALDDKLYVDVMGRANNPLDIVVVSEEANFEDLSGYVYKYTGEEVALDSYSPINNPADIIYHFIEKEVEQVDKVNRESWQEAHNKSIVQNLGFSITEKINSKKLIEDICKSTNIYPKFANDGNFYYKTLKKTYENSDVTILHKDVINFNLSRTPIEDVITMVNVKYKKDYALNEYSRVTGYCDAHDFFGNGDNGAECIKASEELVRGYDYTSFGLTRESNILEFESDFIRTYSEAEKLRDFILMQNCNQHTIIKCTIPLKYINLEVGDIVDFDKLIDNTKAYGEDYTQPNLRNNQTIYPYFMITSVSKSSKNIKIECIQLHKLKPSFIPGLGSLSRRSELGFNGVDIINTESENEFLGYQVLGAFMPDGHFTLEDVDYFERIVANDVQYMTSYQKRNANLNGDDSIDQYDLNEIITLFSILGATGGQNDDEDEEELETEIILGDVNQDGTVNVSDIVLLVNYILSNAFDDGTIESSQAEFIASDMNADGVANVVDIVSVVNTILGT